MGRDVVEAHGRTLRSALPPPGAPLMDVLDSVAAVPWHFRFPDLPERLVNSHCKDTPWSGRGLLT